MKPKDSDDEFYNPSHKKENDGGNKKSEFVKKIRKYQKSIEPDEYDEYYEHRDDTRD